jgi:hypothetical protein
LRPAKLVRVAYISSHNLRLTNLYEIFGLYQPNA